MMFQRSKSIQKSDYELQQREETQKNHPGCVQISSGGENPNQRSRDVKVCVELGVSGDMPHLGCGFFTIFLTLPANITGDT